MKTNLLILIAICLSLSSFSQRIRFTDATNRWNGYRHTTEGDFLYDYTYWADTTINAKSYHRLWDKFIREDTVTKQVLIIAGFLDDLNNDEKLLYDYNWQIGDEVKYYYQDKFFKYAVSTIDSTQVNGQWYKVWHFNNLLRVDSISTTTLEYNVIEGIGSVEHPWFPVYPHTVEHSWFLTCFSQNNTSHLINPAVPYSSTGTFDNANTCALQTQNSLSQKNRPLLSPNPVRSILKINCGFLANGKIIITDIVGRILISQQLHANESIDLSTLLPGIYLYSVCDKPREISHGKLIKE